MASYNRVIMMGNLTRDPDYKQLTSGQSVCRLGLASNRQFKNRQTGMMVQEVCFVDIDVWGPQADSCNQYLQKGRAILVEGRLKLDNWVDNDGNRRSKHSIVADRVTFLPTAAQTETEFGGVSTQPQTLQQVQSNNKNNDSIKAEGPVEASSQSKPANYQSESTKVQPSTGEIDLKNQEPFEDDLPF